MKSWKQLWTSATLKTQKAILLRKKKPTNESHVISKERPRAARNHLSRESRFALIL